MYWLGSFTLFFQSFTSFRIYESTVFAHLEAVDDSTLCTVYTAATTATCLELYDPLHQLNPISTPTPTPKLENRPRQNAPNTLRPPLPPHPRIRLIPIPKILLRLLPTRSHPCGRSRQRNHRSHEPRLRVHGLLQRDAGPEQRDHRARTRGWENGTSSSSPSQPSTLSLTLLLCPLTLPPPSISPYPISASPTTPTHTPRKELTRSPTTGIQRNNNNTNLPLLLRQQQLRLRRSGIRPGMLVRDLSLLRLHTAKRFRV